MQRNSRSFRQILSGKYGEQPQRFTGAPCRAYRWTDHPEKEGRAKDTEEQVRRLNENADRIAELLASATPEYEESVLKEMFRMQVDLTGQEISERLAGNYGKDLQTFWNIQRQIIAMADYFANGLETEAKESGLR